MKVLEPGHLYELEFLDGEAEPLENQLVFVNRTCDNPNLGALLAEGDWSAPKQGSMA